MNVANTLKFCYLYYCIPILHIFVKYFPLVDGILFHACYIILVWKSQADDIEKWDQPQNKCRANTSI